MKMKLLFAFCFFVCCSVNLFSQNWLWAKKANGFSSATINNYAYGVSTDKNGNVFSTGSFECSAIAFDSTILTNTGGANMFIAKFDSSGNVLWAKSAIGSSVGSGVSTDERGNVFVTGSFHSSTLILDTIALTNPGMFLAKYDSLGKVLWAKSVGGNSAGSSVSTDHNGNVFVTGSYSSSTITFDSTTLINANSLGNSYDIFIAKYDSSGNVLWAKSAGGSSYDSGNGVSTDGSGNVFVTGEFDSPNITFDTTILTNASNANIFLVKYDGAGNMLWAKNLGGSVGSSVCTDGIGSVFVTGTGTSGIDLFLSKYDSSGNVLWARGAGGSRGSSVGSDSNGNVFVTGFFGNATITFGSYTLTNIGLQDVFLVKYDAFGNVFWAKGVGGDRFDGGESVCTDIKGNVFVAGFFSSTSMAFDSTILINDHNLQACAGGCDDIFIAKFCNKNASIAGYTTICTGQNATLTVVSSGTNYLWSNGETTVSIVVSPTTTTTYSVISTAGTFTATATTIVTVNSNPPPTAAFSHSFSGWNVILTDASISAPGDPITGWDWQLPGAYFSYSNSQNPGPTCYLYPGIHSLCLTVISSKGCLDKTCDTVNIIYTCPTTSVNELDNLLSITILPNPTSGKFTIQMDNGKLSIENYQLSIYNVLGECIHQQIFTSANQQIDFSSQPSGIYFLQLSTEQGIARKKIMISH